MNKLIPILNRADAAAPDGAPEWVMLAPVGEFPVETDDGRRYVQVLDAAAFQYMVNSFRPPTTGLLVDYDHFSLDSKTPSEAAGWIHELQARSDGLYGRVAWTDVGSAAVINRRYAYISPTWLPTDCEQIGGNRIRPKKLANAALTNAPNLVGIKPVMNRNVPSRDITNQKGGAMPLNQQLAELLGLASDAADDAIIAAVGALKDAQKTAESEAAAGAAALENSKLKNRLKTLEAELLSAQVEKDLDEHKDVLANRDEAKKALLANRESALAMLKALRPADQKNLHNRDGARPPAHSAADENSEEQKGQRRVAAQIRNRAKAIQKDSPGLSYTAAFQRAENEIKEQE
jgi:phage I-like protein